MTERVVTREEEEFNGAILGAMFSQSADMSNRLDQMRLAEIAEWKSRFAKLYNSMHKVAERSDSATAYAALERFAYDMELATQGKQES